MPSTAMPASSVSTENVVLRPESETSTVSQCVTYLTTGLTLGGAEVQLCELAIGFKHRDWNVQVVSMLPLDVLADRLEEHGIVVRSLQMRSGIPNPFAISRLATILTEFGADVLHSHMFKANLLGRLAGKLAKTHVQISTAHNITEGGRWVDVAYRLTDAMADVTTNVSQRAVDRYIETGASPANRIILMRNGLDLTPFAYDPIGRDLHRSQYDLDGRFSWLAVGRLVPGKDYPNMLKAFASLYADRPDARLFIVGRGPLEEAVKELIEETGLDGAVTLVGERSDVPKLMNMSDGYVMSSAWEGAPIVLLEAQASRLPVVVTDVGGNAELVQDGEAGIVVPANAPEALASGMRRVMDATPEERTAMGLAGQNRVKSEFDIVRVIDRWEELYSRMLKQARGVAT